MESQNQPVPDMARRTRFLKSLGASPPIIDCLLEYCDSPFSGFSPGCNAAITGDTGQTANSAITVDTGQAENTAINGNRDLVDEPHLVDWENQGVARHGKLPDGFRLLSRFFPQIEIPVREGVSSTREYGDIARKGAIFDASRFGGSFTPADPGGIEVSIVSHPAGALPVIEVKNRLDFEHLVRGLTLKSEPLPVNPSVYAQMISGIVNWKRVHDQKTRWIGSGGAEDGWSAEMKRIASTEPWRFRDRFILVCRGPYSGIEPGEVGFDMDAEQWIEASRTLRIEHEFTHYATKRLFGSMRNNLLDEIIADYMGCIAALGDYKASWQMAFWGIKEGEPGPGARVRVYRGNLGDEAFGVLCRLARMAAAGLERLAPGAEKDQNKFDTIVALASMTLLTMAEAAS